MISSAEDHSAGRIDIYRTAGPMTNAIERRRRATAVDLVLVLKGE